MVVRGGRVGQLLPQVVLGHFAAGEAVQEGLRFRAFEDFRLADVVEGCCGRVMHLVEVQHLVQEFVLLLLVMQHVDGRMSLVVRRRLLLRRKVRRRSLLLLLLVFGDLRQQLLERFLLLIQVGGHRSVSGAVTFRGRRYQAWDWRINRSVVSANAPRASVCVVFAAESRFQLFNAVDLADVRRNRTTAGDSEQLLQVAVLHLLMMLLLLLVMLLLLLLLLHRRMSQQRMAVRWTLMVTLMLFALLLLLLLVAALEKF